MDLLFASDSIWNWEAEKTYAQLKAENPELVQAARRGSSVVDPEMGTRRGSAKLSLTPGGGGLEKANDAYEGRDEKL